MKPIVFLGPSLPLQEAESVLDALYLPPVRQGELLSAIEAYRPEAVGIVDGLFFQDLSVWHKEILYAIERGVAVFGAGSMGALRAAELASFGMIGVGWVYRQYASGALCGDDEVALAHAPAEFGYCKLSEPLVNIRATLAAARAEGLLSAADLDDAIAAAKSLYFTGRTIEAILAGIDNGVRERVRHVLTTRYMDVKRSDALLLLETLRDCPLGEPRPSRAPVLERSYPFGVLYNCDRKVRRGSATVSLANIVRYAALHLPDFETLRFRALNRALSAFLARVLELDLGPEYVARETRRFRLGRGLGGETEFQAWLADNNLSRSEFEDLMEELAACRRAQRWWLAVLGRRDGKAKTLLDELRLSGRYAKVAGQAADRTQAVADEDIAGDDAAGTGTRDEFIGLVRRHSQSTGFAISLPVGEWAEEVGFLSLDDLRLELLRSQAWRELEGGKHTCQSSA
ncbi:MAG: TfuA-like protein [Bryobacteraceae bacterium]